ncbi:nucleotidyltransferase domain-containing protein [Bradyrhizobium oligotrophicum]|nr:nucleotidyltransferase domain-containing protein [Bradyrhizobium oligotrophicum]
MFLIQGIDFPKMGPILPNMGINSDKLNISDALFSSTQQRVLGLLFGNPERSFYTSEIVKRTRAGTGAVERELSRLLRSGLVSVSKVGNQKHYRADRESPVYEDLRGLVLKTFGLSEPLREALASYAEKIDAAFVYGSVAKRTDTARSDIDVMVIGDDLSYTDLFAAFQQAETILGRQVNPTFLSRDDWRRKLAQKDSFIDKISMQPKIFLYGSEEQLHG